MAKTKEVKMCIREETCGRTFSLNSKFDLCPRCRAHDRRTADREPHWLREHIQSCARWTESYAQHLPRKERDSVVIEYTPSRQIPHNNVTPIRKRA